MKIAADLHIHSCASPCGDDDMTPNNIAGMAAVKGLEMIEKLLLQSTQMDIEELYDLVWEMEGICVPAHINRNANGMLYSLGFMPIKPSFPSVEIYRYCAAPELDTSGYHVLYSSDAHYLWDIFERDSFIDLRENTPQALIQKLRTRK